MSSNQSPQIPTPKGVRNNNNANNNNNHRRPSKKMTTSHTQNPALLSTPPSSPPRNMSPAGVMTDSSVNVQTKKKPPRSGKKPQPRNGNGVLPAPHQNGHRHTNSQPGVATPAKDSAVAYAGPTFHASPAPSALPIPSFFSKSFPESDLAPTLETDSDNAEMEPDLETTPSKPRSARPQTVAATQTSAQASPLDFLFKAAVQARSSNTMSSPEASTRVRSPQTDSKVLRSNPNHTPGGMFPMDLETERARASPIGPSFAPSYQDRMNALRSSSSPSQSPSPVLGSTTEDQNRLKTEQLKYMLLNPRPQDPPSSSTSPPAQTQPGNYGAPYPPRPNINSTIPHYATPMRTSSGPPAVLSQGYPPVGRPQPGHTDNNHHNNAGRPSYPYTHANGSQPFRNTNSPLRREVPGTNGYTNGYSNGYYSNRHSSGQSSPAPPYGNPHYAATAPAPVPHQPSVVSPQPQYTQAAFALPTNSPSPSTSKSIDTKKMEDDLRRILKLDATQASGPGLPSSGMQSSFAA